MNQQSIGLAMNGLQNFYFLNSSSAVNKIITSNNIIHTEDIFTNTTSTNNNNRIGLAYIPKSRVIRADHALEQLLLLLKENLKNSDFSTMTSATLASLFHGLKDFTNEHETYNQLLLILSEKLDSLPLDKYIPFTEETLGQIIGCLKNLKDSSHVSNFANNKNIPTQNYINTVSTRKLIKSLLRHIDPSVFVLSPRKLTYCLSGLKSMTGSVSETKELINILFHKLNTTNNDSTNIGNTNTYSDFHNDNSNSNNKKVYNNNNNNILTSSDIARAFYGIQNMNAKYNKPLQHLLTYLYTHLQTSEYNNIYFTNRDIGQVLYGFKNQHYKDKIPVIFELLELIGSKIGNIPGTEAAILTAGDLYYLNAQMLSMAMLGLQGMKISGSSSSNSHHVNSIELIIEGLTQRMNEVDSQAVGM